MNAPLFLNTPGVWKYRPHAHRAITGLENMFIAGDFCRSKVDLATMEGAVRSGYIAAEAVAGAAGAPARFLLPDVR